MNLVFLTIGKVRGISKRGIYTDLLRKFHEKGHNVYLVCPNEKRNGGETELIQGDGVSVLRVKIGNITKCGMIEKGISTIRIEGQYIRAIKKYLSDVKFDLVMYSTPPITFAKVVEFIKKRDGAKSYLLLKDIFPQNAVDLGMMKKSGLKGLIYKFFRKKEKKLYALSDRIGCMSQANVDYVLAHNKEVDPNIVEICPNSIEVQDLIATEEDKINIRTKYEIPLDKKVFIYGGNLGKPQGIPFLIECLKAQRENKEAYFIVIGDGTEFPKLQAFFDAEKPENMKLMRRLPKEEYDLLVATCDVGMIFLDHRFTIPNFPSRLLAYMQVGIPVLAATDPNTDVGKVIENGGFGWWCESNDVDAFNACVERALKADFGEMREKELKFLNENYTTQKGYEIITK